MKTSRSLAFSNVYPEVRILKGFKFNEFASADSKRVTNAIFASMDSKRVSFLNMASALLTKAKFPPMLRLGHSWSRVPKRQEGIGINQTLG